jgi:8-oxo-dGTP diphosphatase
MLIVDDGAEPLRVLVGERAGAHGAGKLALPGGHLDFGEASFGACAASEVHEETGLLLSALRFRVLHVTNDVMLDEEPQRHYATVFCGALISPEEAAAVRNLEPDKCRGWHVTTLDALAQQLPRLFSPLARLLSDERGESRVRALMVELREARKACSGN